MSSRQTASFLMKRFREAGIRPATRHGQNFLVDLNLVQLLADSAQLTPDDVVLEVGTGTGSLTAMLAHQAAAVVTVEIDPQLYQLANEELIDFENVTSLHQDALKNKNQFHPRVLEALQDAMDAGENRQLKLVANLPYNVATPVISNLFLTPIIPVSMTATIQKELADRMMARPRTKDYSALSVWMQCQSTVTLVREMKPTVFWPRPKVTSAIIHVETDFEKRRQVGDLAFFNRFVRSMFFHRRKFLRSELISAFKKEFEKSDVDAIMESLELGPKTRAEELPVEAMVALAHAVRARLEA